MATFTRRKTKSPSELPYALNEQGNEVPGFSPCSSGIFAFRSAGT